MEKIEWKTLRVKIAAGERIAEKAIYLEPGKRIVAAAVAGKDPGQLVNLGLYENNNEVSAPMDIKFWERSNAGRYVDGFKPIAYKGGSDVSARLSANTAFVEDLEIEIAFGIIKEEETC